MSARSYLLDLSPLKKHRNYRLLFSGQMISYFGTSLTQVAVPYQIHLLTHSTAQVGMIGIFQLGPLALGGILGGKLADQEDRRRLILRFELALAILLGALAIITARGEATTALLYSFVAISSFFTGLHRPALDALGPQLVPKDDYLAMSALNGFRFTFSALIGPSLAAWLISAFPMQWIYAIDSCSYLLSIFWVYQIKPPAYVPDPNKIELSWSEGFSRAWKSPLLLGTYFVDIAAMGFAYPALLFPALSERFGGSRALGFLHSSVALGAFLASIFSGWTKRIEFQGRMITYASLVWCAGVLCMGLSPWLPAACFFLVIAGFFDMISGIFRGTIWNDQIEPENRGKFVGIEMLSYMTGPLVGGAWLGYLAEKKSIEVAVPFSAAVGIPAILWLTWRLKAYWNYRKPRAS